jgi:hypothetical protein
MAGSARFAPSSKVALYLATVVAIYLIPDVRSVVASAVALVLGTLMVMMLSGASVPAARWRAVIVLILWVLAMRVLLDVAGGKSLKDASVALEAARGAARFAWLIIGALVLIAMTPARAVVEELETTRLPRAVRLLVMMLVQYPRVLRDRYDQIVEAQVARGAERPKSLLARAAYGLRILLPVLQSELNAIGERAGLIHLRRLDVDTAVFADGRQRVALDNAALVVATLTVVGAIAWRVMA